MLHVRSLLLLVGLSFAAIVPAQQPLPAPLPWPDNAALNEAQEPSGALLRSFRRRVARSINSQIGLVQVAQPNGFGVVFDLAPSSEGSTFVAASNGIFLIGDGYERSDVVDLRDGVPTGTPYGLHVDDRGVLWLATEKGFGTMHTDDFFGRTFTATDGFDRFVRLAGDDDPPAPPFTGLAVQPDGTMVVYTADQAFAYVPGRLRRPRLQVTRVAGQPFDPDRVYRVGSTVPLQLRAIADGHATVRYRLPNDVNWSPLDERRPVVRGVPLDAHEIELCAFDRELQTSEPVKIELAASAQRPKLVIGGIAGLELVAGGVLWLLVRWRRMRPGTVVAIGLLTLATGAQVGYAMLSYARQPKLDTFWVSHAPGSHDGGRREGREGVVYRLTVHALKASGTSSDVPMSWIGWDDRVHHHRVISLLRDGPPAQERFLQRLRATRYPDAIGFEILARRWRLTLKGPVAVAPVLLARQIDGT